MTQNKPVRADWGWDVELTSNKNEDVDAAADASIQITTTIFDHCNKHIFELMDRDSFRRFLLSEDYNNFKVCS
jgi:hypothetical protein